MDWTTAGEVIKVLAQTDRGLPDRAAALDRPHDPLAKILGQWCCH